MSLVCVDELKLLKDIERLTKNEIPVMAIEGYEVDPSIKAEPIQNGRGGKQQPRRRSGNNGCDKNASANNGSKSRRNPKGHKNSVKRSSEKKSDSPWAKANENRSRSKNGSQNRTESGNR